VEHERDYFYKDMKYTNKIFDAPANSPRDFIGELEDEQAKKVENNLIG